jgi:hypothetical protein
MIDAHGFDLAIGWPGSGRKGFVKKGGQPRFIKMQFLLGHDSLACDTCGPT